MTLHGLFGTSFLGCLNFRLLEGVIEKFFLHPISGEGEVFVPSKGLCCVAGHVGWVYFDWNPFL